VFSTIDDIGDHDEMMPSSVSTRRCGVSCDPALQKVRSAMHDLQLFCECNCSIGVGTARGDSLS
ncbi:hypothetical protein, partial [Salmonella enterica]|uniref:hypothetical protein n=1 Tax=Salmonella enterica TaxID=28901 RepID=UPI001C634499